MSVKVIKLGFLGLNVQKEAEVEHYYTAVLGLAPAYKSGTGEAYFACGNEHHAIALFRSNSAGHRHTGLQIEGEGPLGELLPELNARGLKATLQSDPFEGINSAIEFRDPDGYQVFLYRDVVAARKNFGNTGINPAKLGHVAMRVGNARQSHDFFTQLGFRWSDWMSDFFVFLRCNSDHHTLNFMNSARRGMFHVAFEVQDFSRLGQACDVLGRNDIPLIWGPGRHGIGRNIFTYHRDPDGNVIELYTEMDKMSDESLGYFDPRPYHPEFPLRPKVWPRDLFAANMWGIAPPAGFED